MFSGLEGLHDLVILWLTNILIVVTMLAWLLIFRIKSKLNLHSELLERSWTLIPILILVRIAFPSIHLLCVQDSLCHKPMVTGKLIRNQWNWQREIMGVTLDHLNDVDILDHLSSFDIPLMIVLRGQSVSRLVLTRTDVLHSLGVPSLGVKLDSVPGRLNSATVELMSPGLYPGSCYELCGRGHRAMPLSLLCV